MTQDEKKKDLEIMSILFGLLPDAGVAGLFFLSVLIFLLDNDSSQEGANVT